MRATEETEEEQKTKKRAERVDGTRETGKHEGRALLGFLDFTENGDTPITNAHRNT